MKRRAIVCLAVICAVGLAPPAWASGSRVGIKAGLSLARIRETSTEPLPFVWKDLPFVAGGLFFDAGGWGMLSIEPEILYVQQGGKFDIDAANGLTNRLHYVQVPVQLKLDLLQAGMVRPFIAAGAYGSYLVRAENVLKIDNASTKANVTEDYKRWDWGVIGSAGLAFRMSGVVFSVEGRFNRGLMNILKGPVAGDSIKNRGWMVLLGLSY